MKVELEEEELDGCMTRDEYAALWRYARVRSKTELLGLLCWAEQITMVNDPLGEFAKSQLAWLDHAHEVIRGESEAELPDEPGTPRQVH